jgi:anti-sigma factor RsiW
VSRLSDYLDGELDEAGRRDVAAHLARCPACADVAHDLTEVRLLARALGQVEPPVDLWPALRSRLEQADVVVLPVDRPSGAPPLWRRAVRVTTGQLAAAGLVLALAGGAGAWWLRPLAESGPTSVELAAGSDPGAAAARQADVVSSDGREAAGEAGGALETLQGLLRDAGDRLDPNTARILEKNLAVIERAIDETVAALRVDPDNQFLEAYLRAGLERRRSYLQEARALVEASS